MKILFASLTRHDEPLGIMYLSGMLRKNGHEVRGVMMEKKNIGECVQAYQPQMICYSAMSCEKSRLLEINAIMKSKHDFISVFGGPLATFSPEIIENEYVDAVCVGEGEGALLELVNKLEFGQDISNISNIWMKIEGKIYKNKLRPYTVNLDSIPFADRELFRDCKEGASYSMVVSRGCPFNCSYCFNERYRMLYEEGNRGTVRYRSVNNVIEELEWLLRRFKPEAFAFHDDCFYKDYLTLEEFSRKYKNKINKPFSCSLRPEYLNNEAIVRILKDSGCSSVFTACETGDERIRRDVLRRNISDAQIIRSCDLLNRYKINVFLHNMLGIPHPEASFEDDLKTLELNARCKPCYAWASICNPYPGTDIYEIANRSGLISENYLNALPESYHLETPLELPYGHKVNVLHKLFALAVEFPLLLQRLRKGEYYENFERGKVIEMKTVFDKFKDYKYGKLYDPDLKMPDTVECYVDQLLSL